MMNYVLINSFTFIFYYKLIFQYKLYKLYYNILIFKLIRSIKFNSINTMESFPDHFSAWQLLNLIWYPSLFYNLFQKGNDWLIMIILTLNFIVKFLKHFFYIDRKLFHRRREVFHRVKFGPTQTDFRLIRRQKKLNFILKYKYF